MKWIFQVVNLGPRPTGTPFILFAIANFIGFKETIAHVAGFDRPAINLPNGNSLVMWVKTSA
jgi:hypothetical protein